MELFTWLVLLLLAAVLLSAFANQLAVPWPAFLALGGAALAFVPHAPAFTLDPALALTLFVAPVLLDAAFDTSLRDLKRNWLPVCSLVIMAVSLTTAAVAVVAHWLVPHLPWAAAIALGAIVAPPDAAAATAVLRQLRLPHRLLVILEGESLLNDASALLIYRAAVGAAMAGTFSVSSAVPQVAVVIAGSVAAGVVAAWLWSKVINRISDSPSSILVQFLGTFVVWIAAEHFHLSGILTVVAFGITLARSASRMPARLRLPSFAVWETVVFVVNVLAFLLIGLQLRPIFQDLRPAERWQYVGVAAAVLVTVMVVRLAWAMTYNFVYRMKVRRFGIHPSLMRPTAAGGMVIGWCGMRGIVTLAAALALPDGRYGTQAFPYRDLIVVCAFGVVLGTLLLQGFTIRPLLRRLKVPDDDAVDRETNQARCQAYRAAIDALGDDVSATSMLMRAEYAEAIDRANHSDDGQIAQHLPSEVLRRRTVGAARRSLAAMRDDGRIGDAAFHRMEEELDWLELSVGGDGDGGK